MKRLKSALAIALSFIVFTGCVQDNSENSSKMTEDITAFSTEQPSSLTEQSSSDISDIYPLEGSHKLTYWLIPPSNITTPLGELPVWQELMKNTGIEIEFIEANRNNEKEQLNTLLAAGNYPDIIESKVIDVGTLYSQDVILDLTEIIKEYSPNYYKYLSDNPKIMKQVKSDEGKLLLYAFLRPNPIAQTTTGPIIRKDWLDKLKMDIPETINDWERMLKAFKNELNVEIPLGSRTSLNTVQFLASAWNIYLGFYHDNNVVKYGYLEKNFISYIQTMANWYKEGFLDPNFDIVTKTLHDENMLSNKIGATFGSLSGQFGNWLTTASEDGNYEFDLIGAKFPVLNKGDIPAYYDITQFEYSTDNPWCMISTQCKDIEAAARLLDYTYGEEGNILMNFGIEGKTYKLVNNEISLFSDSEIISISNGISVYDWKNLYTRVANSGPFILDNTFAINSYSSQQYDALNKWVANENKEHKMPPIILLDEENVEYNKIMNDIKNYTNEMLIKFIKGEQAVTSENISVFQNTLRSMNIERALEIQQIALDRYNSR